MEYISIAEFAKKHGVSGGVVCNCCTVGEIVSSPY